MLNNKDTLLQELQTLNLRPDEAKIYLALLSAPSTHLHVSNETGINRTKVYRVAGELEKRGLIARRTDDRGTFLVAADPATLELELVSKEMRLKQQRDAFQRLVPALEQLQTDSTNDFVVHTYEGVDGFKQMLWHELKTQREGVCFGNGRLEVLVPDHTWAERQRQRTIDAGYHIREILNPDTKPKNFTDLADFSNGYQKRLIPATVLKIEQPTIIYNDTVAIYNWCDGHRVGIEIISKTYSDTMRQVFEHYWQLAAALAKAA
jgi:DNA-binding MarR family transcriptional regulator